MSYILDALKRSEQERHQEQLPSFSAESMILHSSHRRTPWWPFVLIAVLLLNALVFIFYNWGQVVPDEVTDAPIREVSKNEPQNSDFSARLQNSVTPKFLAPPSHIITEHNYIKPLRSVITPSKDKSNTAISEKDDSFYGRQVAGGLLIQPKNGRVKNSPKPAYTIEPSQNSSIYTEEGSTVEDDPVDFSFALSGKNDQGIPNTDDFTDTPLLTELGLKFQRTIPQLTFNSHIFSTQASARRVMINNFYLKEGQSFDGLDLIKIGEVFIKVSKNGTAFKLPVLRDWYEL